MPLIATLIASPNSNTLSPELTESARASIGATGLDWLAEGEACDLILAESSQATTVSEQLTSLLESEPIDFAIQSSETRRKKVLIADMDSTMIDQECIDELAAEIGMKEQVSKITANAMNGEIDFEDAMRERVALLEGLSTSVIETILETRITLASGGPTLLKTLNANGVYSALVSGGFTQFTSRIAESLGFHENHANVLLEKDGKLAGAVQTPILGAEAKVDALNDIAKTRGVTQEDFIAVGDGANDLPMLQLAGTGVALHAKPSVAAQANIRINHGDLTSLLYLQGYKKEEFIYV